MPAQTPWYRLLLYFALGFGAAAGLVLLCEAGAEPAVTGTVYDAPTNAPLPGAEVTIWPLAVPPGYDPVRHSAESGPDGTFALELNEERFPARIYVRCDGYLPREVVVAEGGVVAVALERNADGAVPLTDQPTAFEER